MNWFDYDGVNSITDLHAVVSSKSPFSSPEPDVSMQSVPGRSGDLIIDNGRYKNVDIRYDCAIVSEEPFSRAAQRIRAALLARGPGYNVLADSYDADYFRYACIRKAVQIEQSGINDGTMAVTFDCKPYRYSFAGQIELVLTKSGAVVYNYEKSTALPYIKLVGSGAVTLSVNGVAFPVSDVDEFVEIDSESMNTYKGTENKNATTSALEYPELRPGENIVSWTGSVTAVHILPRWRSL